MVPEWGGRSNCGFSNNQEGWGSIMYWPILQPLWAESVKMRLAGRIPVTPDITLGSPDFGDTVVAKVQVIAEAFYQVATVTRLQALSRLDEVKAPPITSSVGSSRCICRSV